MSSLGDKLNRLFARTASGIKFDLRVIEALVEHMGHPERTLGFIHVAGTNGKGSVCAMLDSIFRAAGYRVGLYTSPHIVRFNERIRVNGEPISDAELADLFDWIDPADRHAAAVTGRPATFFELTTAMAFEYFRRKNAELVILETGMGGRLDATNVVIPVVSVITRIGLEHCQYLGDTIEKIAGEKAGIIKKGRPVVCGAMDEEAERVFRRVAGERACSFVSARESVNVKRLSQDFRGQRIKVVSQATDYPPMTLPLLGLYQIENVATAIAAAERAAQELEIRLDEKTVQRGLEAVRWPARCEVLCRNPLVILDVAHNPCGARALAETLRELSGGKKWGLVFSLLADKDAVGFVRELSGWVARAWVVPMRAERAAPAETLLAAAKTAGLDVELMNLPEACRAAVEWAQKNNSFLCIAGSLYLAGDLLAAVEKGQIRFAP